MSTFHERVLELLELPQDVVGGEAQAFLEQIRTWPCTTEVPIGRMAYLLAALLQEPDPNIRRVRVTEGVSLGDTLG